MKQQPVDTVHEAAPPVLLPPGAGASCEMLLDALIDAALALLAQEDVVQSADDGSQEQKAA